MCEGLLSLFIFLNKIGLDNFTNRQLTTLGKTVCGYQFGVNQLGANPRPSAPFLPNPLTVLGHLNLCKAEQSVGLIVTVCLIP